MTPTLAAYALARPAPARDAVAVCDLLRAAALARLPGHSCASTLAGRDQHGQPLTGHHGHAHYLPAVDHGHITGLLVWAPAGLAEHEVAALRQVRRLGQWGLVDWRGAGHPSPGSPLTGPAMAWVSVTPFAAPRYRKHGPEAEFVADMVTAELAYRGLPAPARVEVLARACCQQRPSRPGPHRPAWRVRVEFTGPVAGPLALGYLSHFGLGLLEAA